MIKIDWEELVKAMEDYTRTRVYLLNKLTGEILILSEYMSEAGKSELRQKVGKDKPADYLQIPTLGSREGYKIMEEFIANLRDEKLKMQLQECLEEDAPFKQFKEAVFKHPEGRKEWFVFRQKRITEEAKKWLDKQGVKYT